MKSEFGPEDLRKALLDWSAAARDALGTGDFDKARLAIAGLATFAHEAATEPAPVGWKLVPVEPTEAMLQDGTTHCGMGMFGTDDEARKVYTAMLAAAPQPA